MYRCSRPAPETNQPRRSGIRSTPPVRSFGELIGHVASANDFFCSQAKGKRAPSTEKFEQLRAKDALVKALRKSLAYCDHVYTETTDANFNGAVHHPRINCAARCWSK